MTKGIQEIITNLTNTPAILRALIDSIPIAALKTIRKPWVWSIHKHVCHLAETQSILLQRLNKFKTEDHPVITPFFPTDEVESIKKLSTPDVVGSFTVIRQKQLERIASYTENDWKKAGTHDEYSQYNLPILVRHILMHDYVHMYRIEAIWLTKDEYLNQ